MRPDRVQPPSPRLKEVLKKSVMDSDTSMFLLRVGVLDDPRVLRERTDEGQLVPPLDPMKVKEGADDDAAQQIDIVNTTTGRLSIRWIDGGPGGGLILPDDATDSSMSGITDALEIVSTLSTGIWGGKHPTTQEFFTCGVEFMPPAGSVVLVGFIRGGKPIVLGYWLPQYEKVYNQPTSRNRPLEVGEVRISSFGGSFLHFTNSRQNSSTARDQQVSDVILGHTLGSKIEMTSTPEQQYGELKIEHASGSSIVFADDGAIEINQREFSQGTNNDPTLRESTFKFGGTDGTLDFSSVGDLNLSSNTYLSMFGQGIYIDSSGELSVKARENAVLNFEKGLSINARKNLVLVSDGEAFVTFKNGSQFNLNGKTLIQGRGDFNVKVNANIDIRAGIGTVTIAGLTPPGIGPSLAGVVTANTFCPITGIHVGAIGNSVKASTLAPITPNAPL